MAARSSEPVRTFCVGFEDDRTFDERTYARQIAERFGCHHTELVVDASPERLLEKLLWHHDEPYGDSSALAVFAVAEATKQHVTVALTGDGGDEVFAGYTRFQGGPFAGTIPPTVARLARTFLERAPEPRGYKNPVALLRRFVEHGDRTPDEQLLSWNTFFSGPRLKALLRPELVGPDFDPWAVFSTQAGLLSAAREAGRDRLDQILRHNLDTYLLDDLLVKTDRMTMAVGLEARSPFLDSRPHRARLHPAVPPEDEVRGAEVAAPRSLPRRHSILRARSEEARLRRTDGQVVVKQSARTRRRPPRQCVGPLPRPARWQRRAGSHRRAPSRNSGSLAADLLLVQLELWLRRAPEWFGSSAASVRPSEARPAPAMAPPSG